MATVTLGGAAAGTTVYKIGVRLIPLLSRLMVTGLENVADSF